MAESPDDAGKNRKGGALTQVSIRHWTLGIRIPLPQELRFILLLSHPAGQDKQRVAEAIEKAHEGRIQRLFPPQSHAEAFSPPTNRPGLV